jgi:hypothetical protein
MGDNLQVIRGKRSWGEALRHLGQLQSTAGPDVAVRVSGARECVRALRGQPLAIELTCLLALTAVAALEFGRSLRAATVYDEGVYLASLDALEHGQKLGSSVFASQPPGFYLLLEAERAMFGSSVVAMRGAMLLLALAGCFSAYYLGRAIAGPWGGFIAMALMATPSRVEDEAVRVRADFPSVALSLIAIALALLAVRRKGVAGLAAATFAGGALAAAASVKLLAVTTVVPVLAIVLRRRLRRLVVVALGAGAVAVLAALAGLYATVLGALWNDVVRFHLTAQSANIHGAPSDLAGNFAKVVDTLTDFHGPRSVFAWLLLVGATATLFAWRRRQLLAAVPLWLWAAATGTFLIWHKPLWAHDVVMLTVSLAVASGVGLAALLTESRLAQRVVAAACVLAIAASGAQHIQRTPERESAGIELEAAVLRARTARGSEVASDLPIIPVLADRRQPGTLIDTSWTRLGSGWLTPGEILRTIDRDRVAAVVVGHSFQAYPKLLQALRIRFPVVLPPVAARLPGEHPIEVRIYLPRVTPGHGGTHAPPHAALRPAPQLHSAFHRSYAGSLARRDAKASTS